VLSEIRRYGQPSLENRLFVTLKWATFSLVGHGALRRPRPRPAGGTLLRSPLHVRLLHGGLCMKRVQEKVRG
jgi:hypothetical protein